MADSEEPGLDPNKCKSAFLQNWLEQGQFLKDKYLIPLTIIWQWTSASMENVSLVSMW